MTYNQVLADRWAQYVSKYDEQPRSPEDLAADAAEYERMQTPEDRASAAALTTLSELQWDTVVGIIRPRLILLDAWHKVLEEMSSEGQWGKDLAEELCDDAWATDILVKAGASPVDAAEYAEKEWY